MTVVLISVELLLIKVNCPLILELIVQLALTSFNSIDTLTGFINLSTICHLQLVTIGNIKVIILLVNLTFQKVCRGNIKSHINR